MTAADAKVQFASPAWVALLRATLTELHRDAQPYLAGADFTICEIFTETPPDGRTSVWGARIRQEGLEFFDHPVAADYEVRGDYDAVLPGAKLIYAETTPEQAAAQDAHRAAMTAVGRITTRGDILSAPRSVRRLLQTMHDVLARQTL